MEAQFPRLLAFLVIGLIIGAGATYAYMSSTVGATISELNNKCQCCRT